MGAGDIDCPTEDLKKAVTHITGFADKEGAPAGKSLFFEFNNGATNVQPIYSIKHFHARFVELGDMTEYKAAIELTGTWDKWNQLKTRWKMFPMIIEEWKNEIRTRLMSEAQDNILKLMRDGPDAVKLNAAKWMAAQGWDKTEVKMSPQQRARERKELSQAASVSDDDMERIENMISRTPTLQLVPKVDAG